MESQNRSNALKFANLFYSIGVPVEKIPFLLAQVAHETGNFKSKQLLKNNNASGIVFANKPNLQKNATNSGDVLPETSDSHPYYYAKFATLKDWAVDYLRILNRGKNKPLEQSTIEGFVAALKANGYFTASEELYLKAVKKFHEIYKDIKVVNLLPFILIAAGALYFLSR